jgi:signal transduction histidine kinase/CheY-like chemotaxis protein
LTSFRIASERADHSDLLLIPYGKRGIQIGFHTLSFSRRHDTRFRYRLKGADNNWVETREREAAFSNLPAGEYEFEVQAGSGADWNPESATVRFRVLSPWWRTLWFQSFVIVLCLCGAASIYLQRIRRISRQHDQLERAVEERTRELQLEKSRTEKEKQIVEAQKQEIEKLLQSAQQASRLKGEFLANVSHEIRTPMNGILGMTSLALQTPLSADQREYLEIARNSGESLLTLLNDILDFSKIEANRMDIESVPFMLHTCVQESLQTFASQAHDKGLGLESDIDPIIPQSLIGDPTRLRQVLLNLISNSVKFTQQGKVTLRARRESIEEAFTVVEFQVQDTGPGVPADKQSLIFEAFRQADGSTTRRFGGTGLGLAISSRLVQMMGGRIWVDSVPGQGSTFCFTARFQLPAARELSPESGADGIRKLASAVEGRFRPLRILVAEDNVVNQKLVVRLLEKQGHEVEVAVDGSQALSLVSHKHYDLILMDVQMPEIDGLEATRQIRLNEAETGRRTPILMLTASAMAGDREKCLEAGADGYLPKPVSLERLTAAIDEIAITR